MSERSRKILAAAGIAVFVLLSAAVCWFIGRPLLRFVAEPERFRAWVDSHGVGGRLAFVGMMVLQVFVAIIPGEPFELGAGYAFGAFEGTALCLIGQSIGGILVFAFVRAFGTKAAEVFFSREKLDSLRVLHSSPRRDMLLLIIFLIPGTPKDLICYYAGLTDIKWGAWLLINSFARIPAVLTSTIGGDALGLQNYQFALAALAVTLVISAGGLWFYRRLCERGKGEKD